MRKKELVCILFTIIDCIIFSLLTILLWIYLGWYSLLLSIPGVMITEVLILRHIDKRYLIDEKQKLIQLGLISAADYQISHTPVRNEIDQFRNFIRLNLADLNEILLKLEESYRESLLLLEKGELEDGKVQFQRTYEKIQADVHEIETEVEAYISEFPLPEDKEQYFLYNSYKEQWFSEKQKKVTQIEEMNEKFKVRCQFSIYLEDILRFEVEHERPITESDIHEMQFPYHQAKQLLKFIEKPINFKIGDASKEEKQQYGALGRKIIEKCAQDQVTPNLPYLVIKTGISIIEAKKILTYLHSVGMIEHVFLHYEKAKNLPG